MIKAVFFDWINTTACTKPERHEIWCQVLLQYGFEVSPHKVIRAIYIAETEFPAGAPYRWHESKDPEVFIRYQEILLNGAGVMLPRETILEIVKKENGIMKEAVNVLYNDVLPTLKTLKERGMILGLITNMHSDMNKVCREFGLNPYLNFIVTSGEVGADKPQPPIFLRALELAGVNASEAIYVGDQYGTDVVGARGVGINPVLIDRYDIAPEVSDCPRISSLAELTEYL
ncbi:HAD family hydrolase [Chloroflexota bacterium]